jgi:hypothetical protein
MSHVLGLMIGVGLFLIVQFCMAVCAYKPKAFGVGLNFAERRAAFTFHIPIVFLGRVDVVKVQRLATAIITTAGTATAERLAQAFTFYSFFGSKLSLFALWTFVLPAFITSIRQRFTAFRTIARAFQIDASAFVIFGIEHQLTALLTTMFHSASFTVLPAPILAIFNRRSAIKTIQGRVLSHGFNSTYGYNSVQRYYTQSGAKLWNQ